MTDDPVPEDMLQTELAALLNKHSAENGSNTPDHVLAQYLMHCLEAFDYATRYRNQWYGIQDDLAKVVQGDEPTPETTASAHQRRLNRV